MKLFMRGNVEKSLKDFDDGLENYFATSRRYRSSKRRGSIVLLDKNEVMFKFFKFLSDKCGLKLGIIHVTDELSAKKAIEDLGQKNVKAVVVDASMLGDSLNSNSLTCWIGQECSSIPIWVTNCEIGRRDWIRSQTIKIGIIEKTATLSKIAEAVGFPKECESFISEYAS
jgi:hypothetical protein